MQKIFQQKNNFFTDAGAKFSWGGEFFLKEIYELLFPPDRRDFFKSDLGREVIL